MMAICSDIIAGINKNVNADQTERQGTQLKGLKFMCHDCGNPVMLKNMANEIEANRIIILNYFYIIA
jgi:hypothetical protein